MACVYDTLQSLVDAGPTILGVLCGRMCHVEALQDRADVLPGICVCHPSFLFMRTL